ncbi:MAG: phosphoribosylglycinamide formyltransferase [Lachnospiraceae bacterium]|nr:phosphoribosylglycinamide formyltransferase [Lachnospiraceae bacterium]
MRVGVCVSGGGTNLQAILDRVQDGTIQNASIELVLSNNPGAYALERARKNGIATAVVSPKSFVARKDFHKAFMETLDSYRLDLIVLAGFLVILPPEMFTRYENRVLNVHPSLIPSFCGTGYYGLKVHEAALQRGVKLTGATVHFVNEETDGGPILLQKAVEVKDGDTPEILQRRVMEEAEWVLLPQAIDLIAAGRVKVENGKARIDWPESPQST